ncbi:CPXCG motif-containing cysteine-rich protein [Marinobacter sp. VGCF2001]|uniref:CPXCG motif-containing cysteine-rich protein n=1 Tax=Marinobacter sp. VGCF2001 TaxID=3417189 RepID=UPI003CF36B0F
MSALESVLVQCPYCWETLEISVDPSVSEQEYVEDCQVCCQPIVLTLQLEDGQVSSVEARPENE